MCPSFSISSSSAMNVNDMKKYSIYLLSGIFLTLLCVAAFNWFINPYDMYPSSALDGINKYKSEVERHTRLSKIYQLERIKPDAILLASSRGLVVEEDMFTPEGMTGFNLSLTSASTYELARMFQHAQANKQLKRVVLALDESFTDEKHPGFIENRVAVDYEGAVTHGRLMQRWLDRLSSLLSQDALKASIRTIRKQGMYTDMLDEKRYMSDRVYNAGGHRQMFRTMEASIFSVYGGPDNVCGQRVENNDTEELSPAKNFEKIVELAYSNDIDLYVYFSPAHARLYYAKCMVGELDRIRRMKMQVVDIIEKMAEKYGKAPFPVWDFSGYNVITTEELPAIDDSSSLMRWYWEGSHYTQESAKLLFARIFGLTNTYQDFGVQISSSNIDAHFEKIERQQVSYVSKHDKDIDELNELFNISRK